MELSTLTAISPIDGRYSNKCDELRDIFSEYGLLKYRVQVEVTWLKKLASCEGIAEVPALSQDSINFLDNIVKNFSVGDAQRIKDIEKTTNCL